MNRPALGVRMAGSALGAVLLWISCGAVIVAWYQGYLFWWWAALAVLIAERTLAAFGRVRGYKAWRVDWDKMAKIDGSPQIKRRAWVLPTVALIFLVAIPAYVNQTKGSGGSVEAENWLIGVWLAAAVYVVFRIVREVVRSWVRVFFALVVLLLLGIPIYIRLTHPPDKKKLGVLAAVWVFSGALGLGVMFVRSIARYWKRSRKRKTQEEVPAAPVEWLVGRASSSPSRESAQKNLPAYCARLMGPGQAPGNSDALKARAGNA